MREIKIFFTISAIATIRNQKYHLIWQRLEAFLCGWHQSWGYTIFRAILLKQAAVTLRPTGLQRSCPNATIIELILVQYLMGNILLKAFSVASGALVFTHPQIFMMRCTWVSTHMAGLPNATAKTRLAVLRPTPGSFNSSSSSSGTLPA